MSYGDVRDLAALKEPAEGYEIITHYAAVYKTWAKTPEEVLEPAIEGAKNIFAAVYASIQRLIYTSSTYTVATTSNTDTIVT